MTKNNSKKVDIEIPKDVTFQYKISDNYVIYSIDGVHGGLNAQGDVIVSFFSERQPVPRREKYKIKRDGALEATPIEVERTSDIIRNVNFGIALKPNAARSIGKWLVEKADEFERILKVEQKKGKK